MATVYRGRDSQLRRDVAIKVLFPHLCKRREVVARFQREARAVAALDHPHILRVHDVGGGIETSAVGDAEIDPPYMVLELVPGGSLREHATTSGALLAEVVAAIGAQLCSALAAAHKAGIIHRDIKPANVMIADGGRLVLADFGVARIEEEDSSLVTRTGALLGTPAFMSPEQAQGDPLDERSDVYSLGATLYQLATGSAPFGGPTPKVVFAIAHGELVAPLRRAPAIGAELARVIEKMMARDPAQRYATAADAGAALAELATSGGLADLDAELARYFANPTRYTADRTPAIITTTLDRARAAAARGKIPAALALCDRILALHPDHPDALALVDQLGQGRRRRRGLLLGAGIVLLAGGAYGAYSLAPRDDTPFTPSGVPAPIVIVDAASPPDAARIAMAPVDASPPPGGGRVRVGGSRRDASPSARIPIDAATPVASPPDAAPIIVPPPADATLTVKSTAWCEVSIDSTPHGRADPATPLHITLRPGKHAILCSQGKTLGQWSTRVDLAPGATQTITADPIAPVPVTIAVTTGDSVRLDGTDHKNGATVRLRPGRRYRIEILKAGKPVGTSAYLDIPRGAPCNLRETPVLGCHR